MWEIEWPSSDRINDVGHGIRDGLATADAVREMRTASRYNVPICFWSQFQAHRIERGHEGLIAAWVAAWSNDNLASLPVVQDLARRRGPACAIVSVLFVLAETRRPFLWWSQPAPNLHKVCRRVSGLLGPDVPQPRQLDSISSEHAMRWLRSKEIKQVLRQRQLSIEDLKDDLRSIFAARKSMPMEKFVERLKEAHNWSRLRPGRSGDD